LNCTLHLSVAQPLSPNPATTAPHPSPRRLSKPASLVPPHLGNRNPSYFIVSGLLFVACSEPYLESEYGADYASEAPVKLLDK